MWGLQATSAHLNGAAQGCGALKWGLQSTSAHLNGAACGRGRVHRRVAGPCMMVVGLLVLVLDVSDGLPASAAGFNGRPAEQRVAGRQPAAGWPVEARAVAGQPVMPHSLLSVWLDGSPLLGGLWKHVR